MKKLTHNFVNDLLYEPEKNALTKYMFLIN